MILFVRQHYAVVTINGASQLKCFLPIAAPMGLNDTSLPSSNSGATNPNAYILQVIVDYQKLLH